MKRFLPFLTLLLCLSLACPALAETLVTYYCGLSSSTRKDAYEAFHARYPDVTFEKSKYQEQSRSGSELAGLMLTREFDADVFTMQNYKFDLQTLYQKGYCVDLSSSNVIRDFLSRVYPRIAEACMRDGKIYAVPDAVYIRFYSVGTGWEKAGYTAEDVPDTFPKLLDFLEMWCDRIEEEPMVERGHGVAALEGLDESAYSSGIYIRWLTDLLLDNYIMQRQYANQPLDFSDPELLTLLERAKAIGTRLYEVEYAPKESDGRSPEGLFIGGENSNSGNFPETMDPVCFFRLNDQQPKLIKADVRVTCVYAGSDMREAAIAMLEEDILHPFWNVSQAMLLTDAAPIENPNYPGELAHWQGKLAEAAEALARTNLSADERAEWEDWQTLWQHYVDEWYAEKYRWSLSPKSLENYRSVVDGLYIPAPTVLTADASDGSETLWRLKREFSAGVLTPAELLKELDRIATMMQLEEQ